MCGVLSLPDPLATVRQKLEMIRTDDEYTCGGNGYAYLIRVTSERLIIGVVVLFFSPAPVTASRRQRVSVAEVRRPMRRASPTTCEVERLAVPFSTSMELLSEGSGIQTNPTRRLGDLRVFVVTTFVV